MSKVEIGLHLVYAADEIEKALRFKAGSKKLRVNLAVMRRILLEYVDEIKEEEGLI